jgi:hypothetical protein
MLPTVSARTGNAIKEINASKSRKYRTAGRRNQIGSGFEKLPPSAVLCAVIPIHVISPGDKQTFAGLFPGSCLLQLVQFSKSTMAI